MGQNERGALFRQIVPNQHSRVTYAELFFDLVFVFAVTQISHTLLGRLTPLGLVQTTMLFLAVWWVWVYTSWITNWLNPELTPVRVLLFLLMLGGLVLSTSIPKAFESRGRYCTGGYFASFRVRARLVSAITKPSIETRTRLGFGVIVIGWSGPGSFMTVSLVGSAGFDCVARARAAARGSEANIVRGNLTSRVPANRRHAPLHPIAPWPYCIRLHAKVL